MRPTSHFLRHPRKGFLRAVAAGVLAASLAASPASAKADPAGAGKWEVLGFRADGSFGADPASPRPHGGVAVPFLDRPDMIFLLTESPAYRGRVLGDLTGATIAATVGVDVSPGTQFSYFGEPDGSGVGATVRLYIETDTSLGEITCPCQDKGNASFWYSAPLRLELSSLVGGARTLSVPLVPSMWADAQERPGDADAQQAAWFASAISDVDHVGLSFGGGRHFHNGVGVVSGTGGGLFILHSFTASR